MGRGGGQRGEKEEGAVDGKGENREGEGLEEVETRRGEWPTVEGEESETTQQS